METVKTGECKLEVSTTRVIVFEIMDSRPTPNPPIEIKTPSWSGTALIDAARTVLSRNVWKQEKRQEQQKCRTPVGSTSFSIPLSGRTLK
jgi:hypothetical protein